MRTSYAEASAAAPKPSSRNRWMSFVGALPKKRPYSRVNCDALRYPTRRAAFPASIIVVSISRRASWSRSVFWYCRGLMEVTALNWR